MIALLVFPLPYYVTHASMDYRQPIESVILVMVVAGFALRRERPVLEALSLDREPEYEEVLVAEEKDAPVPAYVSAGWDAAG
jgi:hypothetical protein